MNKQLYRSINDPEIFQFHDSVFELDHVDEKEIAVYVQGLNICSAAEQNPKKYALELKRAHILFCEVSEFTYDPGMMLKTDENGNNIPVGPEIIYREEEAFDKFKKDLLIGAVINSDTIVEGDHYEICGSGDEPFFIISFKAQKIIVEWDEYVRPAWYELTKQFKRELVLKTQNGEIPSEAHILIHYDSEDLFSSDDVADIDPKSFCMILFPEQYGHP